MSGVDRPLITTDVAAFAASLPSGGRLIGLDIGTRTVGIAFCDAQWTFASPDKTLARGAKFTVDLQRLYALCAAERVVGIVAGLPLNMDGSDSPRTQSVRAFARNLAPLNLPLLLWDERWSTQAVERSLIAADVSRAKRAERIDSAAAAFILQGAIDALVRVG